jgi:signal transduction histidine kinase
MSVKLTVAHKGLILISVPLLYQLAFCWLVAEMQGRNAEAQGWASHSKEVLRQAQTVLRSLVDAETGIRGFAATGDPIFTEPYDRATQELPDALQQLQTLVGDNPNQQAHAQTIAAKAAQLMAKHAEAYGMIRSGAKDQAVQGTKEGKRRMDDIRREIDGFLQQEQRLDEIRELALERLRQRLNWLLLAGGVLSFLCTVALSFVFSHGISRRLTALTENAQRLARGNELAPPIAGNDELALLDRAFRDMAAELTRSGEALQKQTRILRSVLENMGDGVVVADEDGKFLIFNPAAEQILPTGRLNAPPHEWTDRYGLYLPDQVTPCPVNDVPLTRAMRGESVDQAELFVRHERTPDGIWLSVTARPLKDNAGLPRGGVAVFRDVSERKRAEEAIQRANDELEQRVQARTAELAESNRQLTQKNQENEMFVYSVSHDLRSPLVNLEGFSKELSAVCEDLHSLLAEDHVSPAARARCLTMLDTDMAEAIRFIRTGVGRLSNIIDALLRLSRAGRVEYQSQHVELKAVVARIVDSMQTTIAEKGATVTVADLPPVWGDPVAVEQIFANLIGNALNYLDPKRPGVIEVGDDHTAGARENDEASVLRSYYVKDNGLGIPESYRSKLFQAFQRLHPSAAKGEGIGLALVRRIVERLGGRIWLESSERQGSTFWVTLPAPPVDRTVNGFRAHAASISQ